MSDAIMRTLSYDGLSFSYQLLRSTSPATEPVLVIGGVLQGMHGWSIMQNHVLPHADLISMDLPGSGDATPLDLRQKMETMCRAVEVMVDDIGVERLNLLGYSFGSAVAYRYAQNRPERIARLALGGVPVRISDKLISLWKRGAEHMRAGDPEAMVDILMEMFLCPQGEAEVCNRDIVRRLVRRMTLRALTASPHGFRTMERSVLENLDPVGGLPAVPTLVFCGEHDTISSMAEQRSFAAGLDDCRFAAIAEADHWVFLERRDEASDLVMRYFTEQPLTGLPYVLGGSALARTSDGNAVPVGRATA
ncbi:alpha/beta fold hydrolase [Streptomyces sp. NPDC005562]|uniref:alpha/beta fold hydrolase n=1 Tax=unclassified Streptomyces TaxID=2593676 RepID=UPI0033A73F45